MEVKSLNRDEDIIQAANGPSVDLFFVSALVAMASLNQMASVTNIYLRAEPAKKPKGQNNRVS